MKMPKIDVVIPAVSVLVVMRQDVRCEIPFVPESGRLARKGEAYEVTFNPQCAVSALVDGGLLGLKPGEFDFLCPFLSESETIFPHGADQKPGHRWLVLGERGDREWIVDGDPFRVGRVRIGSRGWKVELDAVM